MMKNRRRLRNDERGLATVETLPLLLVFVILLAYSFGSFGIIHTGILNSIAARTYAFETMRNRSNVTYFRDNVRPGVGLELLHFGRVGARIHGIRQEQRPGDPAPSDAGFRATERPLRIGFGGIPADASRETPLIHNQRIFESVIEGAPTTVGVSPVWIMTQYGMCINAKCGE